MDLGQNLKAKLLNFPREWDARSCIEEMKENGFKHWRQSEWIGWYFQYLCENNLNTIFKIPGTSYGNVEFDGNAEGLNFDFKAHSLYNHRRSIQNVTILNDKIAMEQSIRDNGRHGLLIALTDCSYDISGEFKVWHQKFKGPESKYVKAGRKSGRPQRKLKTNAKVLKYLVLTITSENIHHLPLMMKQGKNSNGKPRLPKYKIDFGNLSLFSPIEIKIQV